MKKLLLILLYIGLIMTARAQHTSEIGLGWAGNSVNTVVFRKNAITTFKDYQYASYYGADGSVIVAKRKLGTDKWEIKQTTYNGNYKDAHNSISLMVDGDGYLHLSWDHHASKLRYTKSLKPETLDFGPEISMTEKNESKVTYPEFYKMKNGNLLFLYRDGASGQGNLVLNSYDIKTKKWSRVHNNLIDGEGKRNAYWQACIDKQGVFHLSWVWREQSDVATNHDMNYAKSLDGGKTWLSSNNEVLTIPMNLNNIKPIVIIPQKSELINSTSMTTDEKGNPYIATYWRPQDTDIPQYQLIYFNGKSWQVQQVSNRKTPFSLSGTGTKKIPISRPQIVVYKQTVVILFRDEERGNKISVATKRLGHNGIWNITDVNTDDVGQWEPSYDTELWQREKKLDLFVQQVGQGDGEKSENKLPQMVKIINVNLVK